MSELARVPRAKAAAAVDLSTHPICQFDSPPGILFGLFQFSGQSLGVGERAEGVDMDTGEVSGFTNLDSREKVTLGLLRAGGR